MAKARSIAEQRSASPDQCPLSLGTETPSAVAPTVASGRSERAVTDGYSAGVHRASTLRIIPVLAVPDLELQVGPDRRTRLRSIRRARAAGWIGPTSAPAPPLACWPSASQLTPGRRGVALGRRCDRAIRGG